MSGGGGSYTSGPSTRCACNELIFEAILQSPSTTMISKMKTGMTLEVVLLGAQGPVVARHDIHGDVGSIVKRIAELIPCLESGTNYEATIRSISGTQIFVEVRPV